MGFTRLFIGLVLCSVHCAVWLGPLNGPLWGFVLWLGGACFALRGLHDIIVMSRGKDTPPSRFSQKS